MKQFNNKRWRGQADYLFYVKKQIPVASFKNIYIIVLNKVDTAVTQTSNKYLLCEVSIQEVSIGGIKSWE